MSVPTSTTIDAAAADQVGSLRSTHTTGCTTPVMARSAGRGGVAPRQSVDPTTTHLTASAHALR